MESTEILKVIYTIRIFDVEVLQSHTRYVYEIFSDGKVVCSTYEKGIRKAVEKVTAHEAGAGDYDILCKNINTCIDSACAVNQYIDDTSAEVKLVRPFNRVDTMDSGYGNSETDLRSIITDFIYGVGGMKW